MSIGLDVVSVVSLFVESTLYGLFIILFAVSMVVLLLRKRKSDPVNVPLVSVSIAMFVLATIHIGVDLRRLLDALFNSQDVPGGAIGWLSAVNSVEYLLKSTAYAMQTIIGDGFLLYRLARVWGNDKRVVLPLLIPYAGSVVCGAGTLVSFSQVTSADSIFMTELHSWVVSFFAITLFTNLVATFLIAFKIWTTHRRAGAISGASLLPTLVIVVESGVIYSATLVVLISLYLSGNFAQYIALDAVTQIIGVVFSLVIVRVGMGLTCDAAASTRSQAEKRSSQRAHGAYQLQSVQPVAVHITRQVHDDISDGMADHEPEDGKHSLGYHSEGGSRGSVV
ncbi:hypothetical protein FIBSPDRAFT_837549 [Athelia psychrophila]|uniref:Uncharacterized protein n=1 Tax=Athelia psychrophila TaxID=1759441 RepID=A0A166AAT3_9AGAM|nr:hypothetical protein FIBSPDRAFT_837549 [Fibularhizoctonia sp. CBS 109695]